MKRIIQILLLVALSLAVSCSRRVESSYDSLQFVDELVTDSLPGLQRIAKLAGDRSGVIALIGEPRHCLAISEKLLNVDDYDNVDAREVHDGLPDFSGETVVSILDYANAPYDSCLTSDEGKLMLREMAVRNSLAALDSACRCKLLVICSPQMAEYGGDDISDFFEKIGCDVPVIYSADSAFSFTTACYKLMREKDLFTHNISYPAARLLMTVPDDIFPPFMTVPFEDRKVPAAFADTVGVIAPNTYVSHVQNKR